MKCLLNAVCSKEKEVTAVTGQIQHQNINLTYKTTPQIQHNVGDSIAYLNHIGV